MSKDTVEIKKELTKLANSIDSLIDVLKKDTAQSSIKTAGLQESLDIGVVSNIPSSGNPLLNFILS
jgi:hypothetical protein